MAKENTMEYSEVIEIASRAATHAKKEWTAFEKFLDVVKMAQAAKTEADLYKATQIKHAELKEAYASLDAQHKTKSVQLETEVAQKKATMDSDLRSYALGLEVDLKKTRANHDKTMAGLVEDETDLQESIEAMTREKKKLTESMVALRAEAKAHAEKAVAAAAGSV